MNHASAPLPSLGRLVWPWLAVGCMLHLPLDLPIMTTLAKRVATLVTSCTLATCVVPPIHTVFLADVFASCRTKPVGKI